MLSSINAYVRRFAPIFFFAGAFFFAAVSGGAFAAQKTVTQETFGSPEEAAGAFRQALEDRDSGRLLAIFGPAAKELVSSGDPVADNSARETALAMFAEKQAVSKTGERKAVLELGGKDWPFPIPIVEENGRWRFDTKQGKEEILNRRIGRNELGAIQTCLAYVDAQREYAEEDRTGSGLFEYAQKLISDPGRRNGLYWETGPGKNMSPVGVFMANARKEGYVKSSSGKPSPYHGYYFKILKGQGRHAPGGAYDYIVRGRMIGGFALVAYPAKYRASGVMTFLVNHEGIVYEKDLGTATESRAGAMKLFDPDATWKKAE